jgi:hypothetical protein
LAARQQNGAWNDAEADADSGVKVARVTMVIPGPHHLNPIGVTNND